VKSPDSLPNKDTVFAGRRQTRKIGCGQHNLYFSVPQPLRL
jgi:hypothetical protein